MFSILYLPEFSVYLLITMLILPFFLFVSVHLCSRRMRIRFELPSDTAYCGESLVCRLILENPLFLSVSTANVQLTVTHLTLAQTLSESIVTAIPSKGGASVMLPIQAVHSGSIRIAVSRARVLDIFRLFCGRCKKLPCAYYTILPKPPEPPSVPLVMTEPDREMRPTDSPEEFLGVREYRGGDRMRAIHWKLSCRTPEPVVREYGEPVQAPASAALLYALSDPTAADAGLRLDAMLEAVLALGTALCSSGRLFRLIICYPDTFDVHIAETVDDLIPVLRQMLKTPPADECSNCCEQLLQSDDNAGFCVADVFPCPPENMTVFTAAGTLDNRNSFSIAAGTAADTVYRRLSAAAGGDAS